MLELFFKVYTQQMVCEEDAAMLYFRIRESVTCLRMTEYKEINDRMY